jgi:hypothetical protein
MLTSEDLGASTIYVGQPENPLSWAQEGMKSLSYVVFVLSALMVSASMDAVPDPPALTPHTVKAKAFCLREFVGAFREQRLTCNSLFISPHVTIHPVSPADATKPKRSSDWITLAGYATDPSPPVL